MPIRDLNYAVSISPSLLAALLVPISYLCGSIPFGVLVARSRGMDIQSFGSGNIGATNVARALGLRWGLLVFVLDFMKGFGPTLMAVYVAGRLGSDPLVRFDLPVFCAMAAVLGHVFSIWLRFRGGKAGATGLGVGAVICWQAMLVAALVWLVIVFGITRYVSLGTILGSVAYVVSYGVVVIVVEHAGLLDRQHVTRTIFCVAVATLVIARHKDNIRRLMAGTERKINE
jgi:glycerol-3-phosphate acyltransferase PlsY